MPDDILEVSKASLTCLRSVFGDLYKKGEHVIFIIVRSLQPVTIPQHNLPIDLSHSSPHGEVVHSVR